MVAPSPTPRRVRTPNWLDLRLVAGVVLVLASVLAGAKVFASADSTQRMWAASRNLSAGSVLTADDLRPVRVRLPDGAGAYVRTTEGIAGKTLGRTLAAGELVPQKALTATAPATTLTVPLDAADAPRVQRGQRVELWVSTKMCSAVPVLTDVTVQDVQSGGGGAFSSGNSQSIVIRVPSTLAPRVVQALALDGAVLRAGVLDGPATGEANAALSPLDACGSSHQ